MSTVVVRYPTNPIGQTRAAPRRGGLRRAGDEPTRRPPYATLCLANAAFDHTAQLETEANPLTETAAFAEFLDGIAERCLPGQGPDAQPATVVGSYGFTDLAD